MIKLGIAGGGERLLSVNLPNSEYLALESESVVWPLLGH